MILLDTNVISELLRPQPDANVEKWAAQYVYEAGTTTITILELQYRALRLPNGKRRQTIIQGIERIVQALEPRTLSFDTAAARHSAELRFARERDGKPVSVEDLMIASIARAGDHVIATRNIQHFEGYGVQVVNPWTA